MKRNADKKRRKAKPLKSSMKALTRVTLLAGSLLLSNPTSAEPANILPASNKSIRERVELVRGALRQKMGNDQNQAIRLSYSESALAQWGNWGNWRNWGNWNNWNNWRNWGNWGNWGNV